MNVHKMKIATKRRSRSIPKYSIEYCGTKSHLKVGLVLNELFSAAMQKTNVGVGLANHLQNDDDDVDITSIIHNNKSLQEPCKTCRSHHTML